jgi:hypothetical protein
MLYKAISQMTSFKPVINITNDSEAFRPVQDFDLTAGYLFQ